MSIPFNVKFDILSREYSHDYTPSPSGQALRLAEGDCGFYVSHTEIRHDYLDHTIEWFETYHDLWIWLLHQPRQLYYKVFDLLWHNYCYENL